MEQSEAVVLNFSQQMMTYSKQFSKDDNKRLQLSSYNKMNAINSSTDRYSHRHRHRWHLKKTPPPTELHIPATVTTNNTTMDAPN